ncbi:hypothetical protein HELRODRAFT_81783 [Helobdella robusta]|uniref:Hemerythrin-like domain-containing protein n=1 Tax=Helobdella robusta TaxID=6412 RepID=T1G4I7_HELRO|nr:hypothetical protein HELRODRAFT_81783 [Helobdella robusta]ESO01281.1 hypothetical protein HELRODRAFT_81783 [Helobdella robusta]
MEAYEIPSPYEWDESFRVFYDKLDEQHKGLFKGIFDVCKSPSDASALSHLKHVLTEHFKTEEGMMKDAHFSDYDNHKHIHDDFEKQLDAQHVPIPVEKVTAAKEWLVNHIKGIDFKYKTHL